MLELRTHAIVLPGHRIEVSAPELVEGSRVEVTIVGPTGPAPSGRSALEIIQSLRGHRLFQTPEQVQRYLEEERDAWER